MPDFPQFDSAEVIAEQGSPAWRAARVNSVGGSEAAAVCGLTDPDRPWSDTPLSIYRRKLGLDPEPEQNDAMLMGKIFEPAIIRMFRAKTRTRVYTRKPPSYRSRQWPWMTVSPDGLVIGKPHGIEVKRTNQFLADRWGTPGSDEVPNECAVQCQQQCAVLELQVVWVPVVIGVSFRIYKVERNDRLIKSMVEVEREFVRRLETQSEPDPDWSHKSTPALVRNMFGVNGHIIDLSDQAKADWEESERLAAEGKELESRRQALRAKVLFELGENTYGLLGDGTCVRRQKSTIKEHVVKEFEKMDIRRMKVPK